MRILGLEDSNVEPVSDDATDLAAQESLAAGLLPGERLELADHVEGLLETLPPDPNSRLDEMTRIRLEAYALGLRGITEIS